MEGIIIFNKNEKMETEITAFRLFDSSETMRELIFLNF